MNLLLVCLNSSICCAPALKSVTGRYECSEDLLDDRRGSLKFITPLDVSFEKSTKYWFSMTTGILASPNLWNWNSICVRSLNFYPSLRQTLLLAMILKVILARGVTSYWHEGCIRAFHGDAFPTLLLFYFAQKVGGQGSLAPPPARSLSVLGIRMFSAKQEKRSGPLICDVCHR